MTTIPKLHTVLARKFYSYSPGYDRNPLTGKDISVGRRTFGEIYVRIIQRAYRRYRKKSPSIPLAHLLAKCTWNAMRYYGNRKELRTYFSSFQSNEKRELFHFLLYMLALTLYQNVLIQKGYIMAEVPPWSSWSSWSSWTDVLKRVQNPENFQFATEEELHERIKGYGNSNVTEEVKQRLRINLVKFSDYDKYYAAYGGAGAFYIPLLWPSNQKIYKRISPLSEKVYNRWDTSSYKDSYIMDKFMKVTEISYNTFPLITFNLASRLKSRHT